MSANIETVKRNYESFGRGDIPAILATLTPDVRWEYETVDHGLPWLKPRTGPAEVAQFFETLAALDFTQFEPTTFLEGDGQVAVVVKEQVTVRATGRTVTDLVMHLWTFDASGAVSAFRHFCDTHQQVVALAGEPARVAAAAAR
jgi:uncharacterized protein